MSVLFVGLMFVVLIGLVFKEGMCYGKSEAAFLFFVVSVMCLSYFFGVSVDVCGVEVNVVFVFLVVFVLCKYL